MYSNVLVVIDSKPSGNNPYHKAAANLHKQL